MDILRSYVKGKVMYRCPVNNAILLWATVWFSQLLLLGSLFPTVSMFISDVIIIKSRNSNVNKKVSAM